MSNPFTPRDKCNHCNNYASLGEDLCGRCKETQWDRDDLYNLRECVCILDVNDDLKVVLNRIVERLT